MQLLQAITVGGDGFDMAIVPKGTFFNKPVSKIPKDQREGVVGQVDANTKPRLTSCKRGLIV